MVWYFFQKRKIKLPTQMKMMIPARMLPRFLFRAKVNPLPRR